MAWKTGRSRTLTAKGTITGAQSLASVVTPASSQHQAIYKEVQKVAWWSFGAFGLSVSGSWQTAPGPGSLGQYTVSASGIGAAQSQTVDLGSINYQGNDSKTYDIGGTFNLSVPVEEVVDISVLPRSLGDADNGVIDCPYRISVRLYEVTQVGGTATATVTSGTATVTATGKITSAATVGYAGSLGATAFIRDDTGGGSQVVKVTASVAGTISIATSVTRKLRRNAKSTMPARTSPIRIASRTLPVDSVTRVLWSYQFTS